MNYGYFDDRNKEYVITNPKTLFPWINYLGNEDFFGVISNTADDYTFYKDAKFRRLMCSRYNNALMDNGGRYFYFKDADCVWDSGWKPLKTTLDRYDCRHSLKYKERCNHYAFYRVVSEPDVFDNDRKKFVGLYNELSELEAVLDGTSRNSEVHGWSSIASHDFETSLNPCATKDLIFVLGSLENTYDDKRESKNCINKTLKKNILEKFCYPEKVEAALANLKRYWNDLLSVIHIESNDGKLNRLVNNWNQYQCMVTFNLSRSVSLLEVGIGRGMGFRDCNQDLIGFVHQIPESARERIVDVASTQFSDEACCHQYQPLTKRGNNAIDGGFTDDSLRLILGTVCYIKEPGDFLLLDEIVSFDSDQNSAKTLFDHLTVLFNHVLNNLGANALSLIGRADWNDCLNLNCFSSNPTESFQSKENITENSKAESVMIVGWFVVLELDILNFANKLEKNRKQPWRATR